MLVGVYADVDVLYLLIVLLRLLLLSLVLKAWGLHRLQDFGLSV